jgi:hypothetical protein
MSNLAEIYDELNRLRDERMRYRGALAWIAGMTDSVEEETERSLRRYIKIVNEKANAALAAAGTQPDPRAAALVAAASEATDTMTDDELEQAAYWNHVSKVAP